MTKYEDIHRAIVSRIKTKYPDILFSKDIEKGISRPSFFVELDNISQSDFMRQARDLDLRVRIYYFSSTIDNNQMELLRMQDDLTEIFLENNLVEITEKMKFEIDDIELNVVDKVLHCYFDVRISEGYAREDNTPLMENLEYKEG